jgi:hypothetical protein
LHPDQNARKRLRTFTHIHLEACRLELDIASPLDIPMAISFGSAVTNLRAIAGANSATTPRSDRRK